MVVPVEPLAGFSVPHYDDDFDVVAHLAAIPAGATMKGTIATTALDAVRAAGRPPPVTRALLPFKDYPMRDLLELQVACARVLYPDANAQEAMRLLGRQFFPGFTQTLIGKIMYGVFGGNALSIFKLANRSFELTQSTGRVETEVMDTNGVCLHFRDTHTFLSSSHFGILEGTLAALGLHGGVWFKPISEVEGIFYIAWDPAKRGVAPDSPSSDRNVASPAR